MKPRVQQEYSHQCWIPNSKFILNMAVVSPFRFMLTALIISSASLCTVSGAGEPFSYGDVKKWGSVCNSGKLQSPIDITNERVKLQSRLGALQTLYKPAPAKLVSRGHDISVTWSGGDAGGVNINGTFYKLDNIHWHSPSEHTVGGKSYALEAHAVHMTPQKSIAVIGIHYELGSPSPFLEKVLAKGKNITKEGVDLGAVHPRDLQFNINEYYRYTGSLTTPPCTEGVSWTLVKKVKTVSKEQLDALKKAVDKGFENNARPVQNDNGRPIESSTPQLSSRE